MLRPDKLNYLSYSIPVTLTAAILTYSYTMLHQCQKSRQECRCLRDGQQRPSDAFTSIARPTRECKIQVTESIQVLHYESWQTSVRQDRRRGTSLYARCTHWLLCHRSVASPCDRAREEEGKKGTR